MNVVLLEPEIPANTGNIGRTCVATGTTLHLIKPLGFSLDEKALKRAGLDYWQHLDVRVYENFNDFLEKNPISSLPQIQSPSIEMQTTFRKTPITPARIAPFRPSVPAKESNKKLPSKVESTEKPREQVSRSAPSSTPFRDISTTGSSGECV